MHTDDFDGFVVTINGTTHYVDGTVPDKTLNTVSDYNSLLRDMINIPTIHEHYYSVSYTHLTLPTNSLV